jgi:uncharacterized protein (TIGR03083 family)
MTTPSYAELVTAIRREGEGIVTAASMGLDDDVPACDGWTVADLVHHISRVYVRVAHIASTRATEAPPDAFVVPDGDPVEVLRDVLDDVVSALSECDADTPIWNWSNTTPHVAMFWARRMAHESSVHRFDAQAAHGVMQPIDAELASDGIDELIDVMAPRVYSRDGVTGPTGTVRMQSSDGDTWLLRLEPDGPHRIEVLNAPDVVVSGTSNALLLAAYSRIDWTALELSGDADLLKQWSSEMNF